MSDEWEEIRCPACVELGYTYVQPLILFKVLGELPDGEPFYIQTKCWHCKSLVSYELKTKEFTIDKVGVKNHRRQTAAFE